MGFIGMRSGGSDQNPQRDFFEFPLTEILIGIFQ